MIVGRSARTLDAPRAARAAAVLLAVTACVVIILSAQTEPEPDHPEWAAVTKELTLGWPLVVGARYDPANHFVLVDLQPGTAGDVAVALACEAFLPLLHGVDATVGFALYEAPDRVLAHADDCAISS